uniref:hypothetical protein n=1 Tax=Herbidospora sakaeratensis TaxID=564415 RepID=UPI0007841917|nr:hypothetical protein [Herbidospora sakaeratensis]
MSDPLDHFGELLLGAYVLISKTLGWLPLAIELPPVGNDWTGEQGAQAIDRARIAVRDLPLDETTSSLLVRLLLEWLDGYTIWEHAMDRRETLTASAWQYESIAYTLVRIESLHQVLAPRLRPETD